MWEASTGKLLWHKQSSQEGPRSEARRDQHGVLACKTQAGGHSEVALQEGRRAFDTQEKGCAMLQIEVYGLVLGFLLRHVDL